MAEVEGRSSVLFVPRDYWACGWYRCYVPGVELKRLGYRVVLDTETKPADTSDFDVLVVQAPATPDRLQLIQAANAAGKLTVCEFDDDVWSLAPSNPSYLAWNEPQARRVAMLCLEAARLATTPTHVLADKLRQFNPRVKVLPNMLPRETWDYPEPKEQRPDGRIVLGWAGSTSHDEDLAIAEDVVLQLLDRYPNVEWLYAGGSTTRPLLDHDRVSRMETTDITHYPTLLERFDIGLIPLVDSPFNRAKSDLKFVEYSRLGIPSVASKVEPYLKTVKHGENGFLATNAKDWLKSLTRLIEDVELRRRIGAAAYEYALTRHIDCGIDRWERAYGLARPSA